MASLQLNPASITRNLDQGMNGADVTALQKALIAAGYSIPDGATGYYGPQTKAAVAKWQQDSGIDNSTGPGSFGPRSKAFLTNGSTSTPSTTVTNQPSTPAGASPSDDTALRALGLSDDTISQLSPAQKAMFAATGAAIQAQYSAGRTVPNTLSADDLDRIFTEAQNDPGISDYYKEQLRIGGTDLTKAIAFLQGDYSQFQRENAQKFALDNKNLSEAEAAAGTAYSGFRGQAKKQLSDANSGIIESTKRTLGRNLESMGSAFEKTYGSDALAARGGVNVGDVTYDPIGNVSGSQENAELTDVRNRANELGQEELLNRGPTSPAPVTPAASPAPAKPVTTPTTTPAPITAPPQTNTSGELTYEQALAGLNSGGLKGKSYNDTLAVLKKHYNVA